MYSINHPTIVDNFELCDDWGFYIDIESNENSYDNAEIIKKKYKIKNLYPYNKYNKFKKDYKGDHIETICEEYEYYCKKSTDNDDASVEKYNNQECSKNEKNSILIMVSSTTLITFILTYVIYFVM